MLGRNEENDYDPDNKETDSHIDEKTLLNMRSRLG